MQSTAFPQCFRCDQKEIVADDVLDFTAQILPILYGQCHCCSWMKYWGGGGRVSQLNHFTFPNCSELANCITVFNRNILPHSKFTESQ